MGSNDGTGVGNAEGSDDGTRVGKALASHTAFYRVQKYEDRVADLRAKASTTHTGRAQAARDYRGAGKGGLTACH